GIQQSRYMVLSHRVDGEERNQINRVLVDLPVLLAGKDRADELPEALHVIEVGRLAARDAVYLSHDPQQGHTIEVHSQPPSRGSRTLKLSRRARFRRRKATILLPIRNRHARRPPVHDKFGLLLKAGDKATIQAEVVALYLTKPLNLRFTWSNPGPQ